MNFTTWEMKVLIFHSQSKKVKKVLFLKSDSWLVLWLNDETFRIKNTKQTAELVLKPVLQETNSAVVFPIIGRPYKDVSWHNMIQSDFGDFWCHQQIKCPLVKHFGSWQVSLIMTDIVYVIWSNTEITLSVKRLLVMLTCNQSLK